ncbi:MAG: hypothetical protein Q8O16_06770, partial [Dehalococcoidia bacterium]|nr:hypothetical protein [Dehalococcoidia bacterium]
MKLDWRKNIIYTTMVIMEGSWLYASLTLLNSKAAGESMSVWGLLLVFLVAFASTKALRLLRWHKFFTGCISWLLWVTVMLLTVKVQLFRDIWFTDTAWLLSFPNALAQIFYGIQPVLLVLVSSGVLWWLGRRLANHGTGFAITVAEFQFGLV